LGTAGDEGIGESRNIEPSANYWAVFGESWQFRPGVTGAGYTFPCSGFGNSLLESMMKCK
jgi:hypothetical protein